MTTETTSIEESVCDILADLLKQREGEDHAVHVQAIQTDSDGTVWVELAERVRVSCGQCRQPLGNAGPVVWMARQGGDGPSGWWEKSGAHSQQHGCGAWQPPESIDATITVHRDEDEDLDTERLEADLRQLVRDLRRDVESARRGLIGETAEAVARSHAEAIEALARYDASMLTTGDEPGTFRVGDLLTTWDWPPVEDAEAESVFTPIHNLPPSAQEAIALFIAEAEAR